MSEYYTAEGVTSAGLKALAAPFNENQIDWKVQTLTKDEKKAMVVPYIDARAVQNRFDSVCGAQNWKNLFRDIKVHGTSGEVVNMLCGISVRIADLEGEWLTKWNGSNPTAVEAFKGVISTAERRAAVEWGPGRDIYDLELEWVELIRGKGGKCKASFKSKIEGKTVYATFNPPTLPAAYKDAEPDVIDGDLADAIKITGINAGSWDSMLQLMKADLRISQGKTRTGSSLMAAIKQREDKKIDPKDICADLIRFFVEEK